MTAVTEPTENIRFEGYTVGTEIWGATQANFLIAMEGRHAKEAAILLNDPAAKYLAEVLGAEDSEEFRQAAARAVGQAVLREALANGRPFSSITTVSRTYFDEHPGVLEAVRAALG